MLGRETNAYKGISKNCFSLVHGVVICMDPSIGSRSSAPGYAVYVSGVLRSSGTLDIDPTQSVLQRLQRLAYLTRRLYSEWDPGILVYEEIPAQRHGGNAMSHASLLKALGVILSISGPDDSIGLYPASWKKLVRDSYVKSDENDAIELGWICISHAQEILEEAAKNYTYKKTKSRRKK